ncbi:MAG TPA: radical SAM protein [Syntrophales bacterium]|nr:radical SAM protein [Syntrophales bacterium]
MSESRFQYVYGPVPSWRVGSSLGVDLLSQRDKVCSYDCVYCQLGRTKILTIARQVYVPDEEILKEVESLPDISIDYITFSGKGEPTLAQNLGSLIRAIRTIRRESVAVITNSSLIDRQDVRNELSQADFVIAKLDASSRESFMNVNRPYKGIEFDALIAGMKEFRKHFKGKLALQVMFIRENVRDAEGIASIAHTISPDEVQINTPLRPCGIDPLGEEELSEIKRYFKGLNAISVYESRKKYVKSISDADTLKRRGKV